MKRSTVSFARISRVVFSVGVAVHRGGRGRCAEVTIIEKLTEPSVSSA